MYHPVSSMFGIYAFSNPAKWISFWSENDDKQQKLELCPEFHNPHDSRKISHSFPPAETVNQTTLCSPDPLSLQQHIRTRCLRRPSWGHRNTQTREEILLCVQKGLGQSRKYTKWDGEYSKWPVVHHVHRFVA